VIGEYSNYLPQDVTLDYSPAGGYRSLAKRETRARGYIKKTVGRGFALCALANKGMVYSNSMFHSLIIRPSHDLHILHKLGTSEHVL
jgi:hypothetical protein